MYLDKYIVSNIEEALYTDDYADRDQLRYERELRGRIARRNPEYPAASDTSQWHYWYSYNNPFVDRSTFYTELTRVEFSAISYIDSDAEKCIDALLWTYGAVTIWVNGKKAIEVDVPCYKPIMKKRFSMDLKAGRNEIYVLFQNLGVRDTRNIFAIEIPDGSGLMAASERHEAESAGAFLDSVTLSGRTLKLPYDPGCRILLGRDSKSPDFSAVRNRVTWEDVSGCSEIVLSEGKPYIILEIEAGCDKLRRYFEVAELVKPLYPMIENKSENFKAMLSRIASVDGLSRGDKFGFYIQTILARKAIGQESRRDEEHLYTTLDQIESRYDCSDFLISGLIRYMKNYPVSADLENRISEVLKDYRYWMTMDGTDAMCFWSENHSLLFYSCAMIVGAMYPDMHFTRAHMTGRELSAFGRRLAVEWFDDVERYGFEEFLSTVYMNITLVSLLNIIDYGDSEISERAVNAADKMIRELAMHTFDGVVIAPMGRVYRNVINPPLQGVQTLINIIDPSAPTSFGEGWLSYLATSRYRMPDDALSLMKMSCNKRYSSGNAEINLLKTSDYCLTSVSSPRTDGYERWRNITLGDDFAEYENSHLYTKSFNERFHGTTFFQPGVYGYQQHMWTASLSAEAIMFVNHPGSFSDHSSMRPGYWYGNGIMPALKQENRILASIYRIPDDHPIGFTHVYFPECHYDEAEVSMHWIFARKRDGYIALYSSGELMRYNDELSSSELRVYMRDSAYVCFTGSLSEDSSYEEFKKKTVALSPEYENGILSINGRAFLSYKAETDTTQYV